MRTLRVNRDNTLRQGNRYYARAVKGQHLQIHVPLVVAEDVKCRKLESEFILHVEGNLEVEENATIRGQLTVKGNIVVGGAVFAEHPIICSGDVSITNPSLLKTLSCERLNCGLIHVSGDCTLSSVIGKELGCDEFRYRNRIDLSKLLTRVFHWKGDMFPSCEQLGGIVLPKKSEEWSVRFGIPEELFANPQRLIREVYRSGFQAKSDLELRITNSWDYLRQREDAADREQLRLRILNGEKL